MYTILKSFGDEIRVAEKLHKMEVAASDTYAPLLVIAEDMMKAEGALFASGGRRGGGSWARLKPDTIKRKGSTRILYDTGTLEKSLTVPGAEYQVLNIGKDTLEFGTSDPVAGLHQHGTYKMPARPVIKFTTGDSARWMNIIVGHLVKPFAE